MPKIRVAAPLFCPTIQGVIGETVKRRTIEDGQNRDIFAPRFGQPDNRGAIRSFLLRNRYFERFAGTAIGRCLIPPLPTGQGGRADG
jgi:hypothetical protein